MIPLTDIQIGNNRRFIDYLSGLAPDTDMDQRVGWTLKDDPKLRVCIGCHGAMVFNIHRMVAYVNNEGTRIETAQAYAFDLFYTEMQDLLGLTEQDLVRHGAPVSPFGTEEWEKHPADVFEDAFNERLQATKEAYEEGEVEVETKPQEQPELAYA